ncbi:unnamed protein product [Staurois parvus]|uniref:Uncharacterized protein n=1 Tax=Staurois parvus TaxID=386267 RepID=A0ABN9AL70_9NEOB|nr:unnamed protein product [Staurois parvus]
MPASVIWVLSPASVGMYGGWNGRKFENDKNKTLLYQTISHTFCPECFVLCPACIFTVLSAWKLRNVHGVQKNVPLCQKRF